MSLIPPLDLGRFPTANVLHTQLQLHHQMLYRQHNITHHHHHPADDLATNGWLLPPTPGAGPTLPGDVTVSLQNAKLWQQFHAETTEMIITKLGRRMFPSLQLQIEGLERRGRYCLLLEVAPASRRRHKYVGGGGENGGALNSRGWTSAGPAEPQPHVNRRVYVHPDSPATGTHWMQHPVSFNKLKLTNNAVDHHSNVVLTSMHKYVPRIWIVRCDDIARLTSLFSHPASSFCFPETEFIAVTAYQNENITKLKIDNNPFAKGFRETGQSRCKRKMHGFESSDLPGSRSEGVAAVSGYNEDEESNMSSSESESNPRLDEGLGSRCQRAKRAASESGSLDDSGVSSSSSSAGSASPPLVPKEKSADSASPQPRLHRPWADNDDAAAATPRPRAAPCAPETQWQHRQAPFFHAGSHQREILPISIDLARIHHFHRYHQQLQQYEQYCHISQINQLKNLALQFPLHGNCNAGFSPSSPRLRTKYSRIDHIIDPVALGTPPASPATSQDGTSGSS